jgi:hypothetical protein
MKSEQQQSSKTHQDLQLLFWSFLHPNLFEQFKALEFELKMDLHIKKKESKKKNVSRPYYFRPNLSPSTRAPSSFSPRPRPSSEPNVARLIPLPCWDRVY